MTFSDSRLEIFWDGTPSQSREKMLQIVEIRTKEALEKQRRRLVFDIYDLLICSGDFDGAKLVCENMGFPFHLTESERMSNGIGHHEEVKSIGQFLSESGRETDEEFLYSLDIYFEEKELRSKDA